MRGRNKARSPLDDRPDTTIDGFDVHIGGSWFCCEIRQPLAHASAKPGDDAQWESKGLQNLAGSVSAHDFASHN
jgi:hypothetical protein